MMSVFEGQRVGKLPSIRGIYCFYHRPLRLLPVTESVALPPEARWNAMTDYPVAIPVFAIRQLRCPSLDGSGRHGIECKPEGGLSLSIK